jgi:SPFH domain / Band 7 family
MGIVGWIVLVAVLAIVVVGLSKSVHLIGPAQIGLVTKRFALKKLPADNPIAFHGEAGYQARTLMPGLRIKLWPLFVVQKHPWVQVPAGEIGVVIAQVGDPLPIGAKSGVYRSEFANFADLGGFIAGGGQKGVQRPVLPPGTLLPIHPVAFLVLTANAVYGLAVSPEITAVADANRGVVTPQSFGLSADQLRVTVITPQGPNDVIGIVTVLEGEPLPSGDIASRLGGFDDVLQMETPGPGKPLTSDAAVIELLLGNKNGEHNNYQDFQLFLDSGGKIGLQHDPLLYGAYLLNPFLVRVELVPMLVVNQGEVAVIKAFVGLPTLDMSGVEFKFGSIVRPGHRGIWQEPLRTGKYPINPRCYAAEIVPTSILTLNWSRETSAAHGLDSQLAPIDAKSREGFVFSIDLQVQIHVPDTKAPKVISMVGTMLNLVNEVLQSAVGNHFRNTLQDQPAITFIETRMQVQVSALQHVTEYLQLYEVETKGVYIQNVTFPVELVDVLTKREIANQQKATFEEQRNAETARIEMEKARGTADMQGQLASSQVNIAINGNRADAREEEARGEAAYVELTGRAEATKVEAIGLANAKATEALGIARAEGFEKQVAALGQGATAVVAVANAVSEGNITVVPEVLVTGGGGSFEGLAATLMRSFANGNGLQPVAGGNGSNGVAEESSTPDSVDEIIAEAESFVPEPPARDS